MAVIPTPEKHVAQLIDANLDRAREGLRVIEDWCRYGLQRKDLIIIIKDYRHQLGRLHQKTYKQARSAQTDQGSGLTHEAQNDRISPLQIVSANCARVQEALRVIEEFARNIDPELTKAASKIRYEIYDLEINIQEATSGKKRQKELSACKLCLITTPHQELIAKVSAGLKAGVGMVQYRCKKGKDIDKFSEAEKLAVICKDYGALFIVNDRIDIALAVDADGIHIGQEDLPLDIARKLIGPEKLIGVSCHSLEEAQKADKNGSDYIGFGPIFRTTSKPEVAPLGLECLKQISNSINQPCFAIGGINHLNRSKLLSTGVSRIAVIDAIMKAEDPFQASKQLLEI
ncbi:thiamine phosphate synthase [Prochlorococcus marinus]|uniref:Thiamine-phosphate synthase n=1 Tax=Prochlorococcus marinus (strain MIT 9211) TaxID=93059 RepID=A9BBN8_PROM4|nr:thiamine phosphate synthase [Prochlorococcus marinus]ABX09250.1 Thiamine monophosphate synthase (TMP) [Prochlorococcus marinus str. MIT 9211]